MTVEDLAPHAILARALAAAGGAAWARVRTLHFKGSVRAGGLAGPWEQWIAPQSRRHAMQLTLGPATMAAGHDGLQAWQRSANGEVLVQDAEAGRRAAATDAWIHARGWWFPDRQGAAIESLGRREAGGAAFDVLRCVPEGGQGVELWFDAASFLLARLVQDVLGKPALRRFEDYRETGGLRLPFRISSGNGDPRFDRVTEIATVAIDETPPAGVFDVPPQAFGDLLFLAGGSQARLPIELVGNHVFVPVEIAGHALRFLLDTGGVNLLAAAAAQRLGLGSVGAIEARGPGEKSVGSGFARVERLVVGGAVALERQLLRVLDMPGFDDVEGVQVDGVLGVELFKRLVVQIDYAACTLLLADSVGFAAPAGAASLPVTFFGHFPGVAAEIDGVAGQFWLDTGNRGGVVLLVPFVEEHGLRERYAASPVTTIGWGVGGRAQGRLARGGRLVLGDAVVTGPVLRLPVDYGGALAIRHVAGNIGGEILRRFVVTFDHSRRVVHLVENAASGSPFEVDRSGLWINRHADGAIVCAVMAGSPAATAGLEEGDAIVSVDGEAAASFGLDALRRRLAGSAAGTRVTFELRRGDARIQAALVLRDLV